MKHIETLGGKFHELIEANNSRFQLQDAEKARDKLLKELSKKKTELNLATANDDAKNKQQEILKIENEIVQAEKALKALETNTHLFNKIIEEYIDKAIKDLIEEPMRDTVKDFLATESRTEDELEEHLKLKGQQLEVASAIHQGDKLSPFRQILQGIDELILQIENLLDALSVAITNLQEEIIEPLDHKEELSVEEKYMQDVDNAMQQGLLENNTHNEHADDYEELEDCEYENECELEWEDADYEKSSLFSVGSEEEFVPSETIQQAHVK